MHFLISYKIFVKNMLKILFDWFSYSYLVNFKFIIFSASIYIILESSNLKFTQKCFLKVCPLDQLYRHLDS